MFYHESRMLGKYVLMHLLKKKHCWISWKKNPKTYDLAISSYTSSFCWFWRFLPSSRTRRVLARQNKVNNCRNPAKLVPFTASDNAAVSAARYVLMLCRVMNRTRRHGKPAVLYNVYVWRSNEFWVSEGISFGPYQSLHRIILRWTLTLERTTAFTGKVES